jgi:site-specific recombinase XerD
MLNRYFQRLSTLERLRTGPAGPFLDGFIEALEDDGFAVGTVRDYCRCIAHFCQWATRRRIATEQWNESTIELWRRHGNRCRRGGKAGGSQGNSPGRIRRFFDYLRTRGVDVPPRVEPSGPAEPGILLAFRRWMVDHRGLTESTLWVYARALRPLLKTLGTDPNQYDAARLRTAFLQYKDLHGRTRTKAAATALRVFVRFLVAEGRCPAGLEAAIPTVAGWRLSSLPCSLPPDDVERVLAACDISTRDGSRDRAVLLLLARLGLRPGDIVALRLGDIDWHNASLRVSGKGRHEDRLPLTQEVGDALLAYLEHGRPAARTAVLFVHHHAPVRGWSTSRTITGLVGRALRRAGVRGPVRAAYAFRHAVATDMLRQGATLTEIGALLRHRSSETTAIYAKVDVALLKTVAQPWPEETPC